MTRLASIAFAFICAFLIIPAVAFAQTGATFTVGDASEAWYRTGLLGSCSSPIGCPPVSAPSTGSYPANTLHVGVMAGQTMAVTYVQPDLSDLPAGDTASGGTMTLPLATMANNGNQDPAAATIEACLATAAFTDGTQGSTRAPPSTDCSVHEPVTVGATAFSVDLGPFIAAWNSGRPAYGIALIPDPASTGPTSSWQVSFNGRRLPGAPHIASVLTATAQAAAAPAPSTPAVPSSSSPAAAPSPSPGQASSSSPPTPAVQSVSPPAISQSQPALPAAPAPAPASSPVASPPPLATRIAASGSGRGFQYPEVMLLPLAFAAGLVFVARVLTSDATPKRRPA